jgi:hypothetical protein
MDLSNWDLDYMNPKGTSHTSVLNSTYEVPKGTMKTKFEPSLPRISAWKNNILLTQDSNPGPLHQLWVFWHWNIARDIECPQNCWCEDLSWGKKSAKSISDRQLSFLVFNGTNIDLREHLESCFASGVVRHRAGGRNRPSRTKSRPAGSLSSSQPGGPPCWASPLAFGLTGDVNLLWLHWQYQWRVTSTLTIN